MLKNLKDVLEKDKTRFSNEELTWQQSFKIKPVYWFYFILLISFFIVALIGLFIPGNKTQMLVILVIWGMILILTITVCFYFFMGSERAKEQLIKNLEQEKKKKILSCIEQRDFSRLLLENYEIAQALFQLAAKEKLINFNSNQELKMTFIDVGENGSWCAYNEENLLEFFGIKEEE